MPNLNVLVRHSRMKEGMLSAIPDTYRMAFCVNTYLLVPIALEQSERKHKYKQRLPRSNFSSSIRELGK
jgi:hypothetical protein